MFILKEILFFDVFEEHAFQHRYLNLQDFINMLSAAY